MGEPREGSEDGVDPFEDFGMKGSYENPGGLRVDLLRDSDGLWAFHVDRGPEGETYGPFSLPELRLMGIAIKDAEEGLL